MSDVDRRRHGERPVRGGPVLIATLGVVFMALWGWYLSAFDYFPTGVGLELLVILEVLETLVMVGISGSLVFGGYWFWAHPFDADQEWWGALWTLIGGLGIMGVVLLVISHQLVEGFTITPRVFAEEVLMGGAGGSLAGFLIGIGTAESLRRTDQLARQRDVFAFLNALLRHNILNGIQVIRGKAIERVSNDAESLPPHLEAIVHRCRSIAHLTESVSDVAGVISGTGEFEPVNLSELLLSEVETAQHSFDEATFVVDVPGDVTVRANPALRGVFDNLLTNAVKHHDGDSPRVIVNLEDRDESMLIEIADDGPGIDESRRESIFEAEESSYHGLGLFLVDTIVSHHGGTITVEDNVPRGSVFRIELPKDPTGS